MSSEDENPVDRCIAMGRYSKRDKIKFLACFTFSILVGDIVIPFIVLSGIGSGVEYLPLVFPMLYSVILLLLLPVIFIGIPIPIKIGYRVSGAIPVDWIAMIYRIVYLLFIWRWISIPLMDVILAIPWISISILVANARWYLENRFLKRMMRE